MMIYKDYNMKRVNLPILRKGLNFFFQCLYVLACIIFSTIYNPVFSDTIITNTATANFSINGSAQQLSDSIQFTKDTVVTPTDEITLDKQANTGSVEIGELITYTLTIQNPNSSVLENLVVQDILPSGLSYVTGTAKLNSGVIPNSGVLYSGNLLKLSLGSIPANSAWIVNYQLQALTEGVKLNKATVSSDTATSEISQASVDVTKSAVIPTKPLTISKQANTQKASLGDVIEYHLTIGNPNNIAINSSVLNDSLPVGLVFVTNSALLNNTPVTANTSNGLSFNLGTIPANAQWTLSYKTELVSVNGSNSLINSAYLTTGDTAANSDTATASVEVTDEKILINKSANKSKVIIGETILYSITISNPEDHTLSNILISDTLPQGFIYKLGTALLEGNKLADSAIQYTGTTLNFSIGSLGEDKSVTLVYEVKVSDQAPFGKAVNKAQADSDIAQSTTTTATVIVDDSVYPITLIKKADVEKAKLGDIIEYSLTINNPNYKAINKVTLNDLLPTGLVYINDSALLNGEKLLADTSVGLSFELGAMPADTEWVLTYQVKLESSNGKDVLINKASISTESSLADSIEASSSIEISDEKLSLSKAANKEKVLLGDTVLYTIKVSNPENHTISDIIINDTLPLGFSYQIGTATIDTKKLSATSVQVTNNNLQFLITSIKKDETITLTYEVLITENAGIGDSVNTAQAKSDFAQSEIVSALVKVRTPSTIEFLKINENGVESIIPPTSYNDNQSGGKHWQEVNSITLADGTIILLPTPQPLVEAEQYTLLDPIVIKVQDLDQNIDSNVIETIIVVVEIPGTNDKEVLLLQETAPDSGIFVGIIPTTSGPTNVQNGVLSLEEGSEIKVTYHDEEDITDTSATAALIIPNTPIVLDKTADKDSASIGEMVRYTLTFTNTSNFTIPELYLKDLLPLGFRYMPDTASLNDVLLNTGVNSNGRELNFTLGKMPMGQTWTLEYLTKITAGVQIGKAINAAIIDSGKFKSNHARATVLIKDELMRSKNILTGRVYIGCETGKDSKVLKDARIFNETGRSILTDEKGFWHMEGVEPGTHVLQIDSDSLPAGYEAILCQENTRFAGNPNSQFVDLMAGTIWQVDFHVKKSNMLATESDALIEEKKAEKVDPKKLFGSEYLKTAPEGFEILWPKNNFVPDVASTKIFVKSSIQHKVEVFLNGKKVNGLNYDGSETNKARRITVKRWFGVDINIKNRNNTLLVIAKDKSGKEVARKTHNIHFSGEPASAEYLPEESVVVADGKTTPIIALRIKDQDGYPMRANTHGYFTIENSRFRVKKLNIDEDKLDLNEPSTGSYKYIIEANGIARIELNPTTQSGEVKLKIKFNDTKEKTIRAWLKPKLREWIMVGLAEGTLAHKTVSGNMQSLKDLGKSDNFSKRGRLAFFAKGKVKGKYLLTIAYDTHKAKQEVGSQLEGNIDPDAWYTIYADNSNNQYNAPSSRKLYLKIEKDNFFTLFGDYNAALNVTELAKYERVLNGIKSEYRGKNISYNAFISETSNAHHHDEIPGDGTSGLYHLSHDIITNSETIRIETRDRFHSERILETRELVRYQDYNIDYEAGTLFFKFPITGRDENFNPNIIVIDYDSETENNKEIVAGGRVAFKTENDKLEAGFSAIHIGRNKINDDSLVALDATYKITTDTKIHAEIAQSKTELSNHKSVSAQLIELEKEIANMEARLYYRKQGENFGIDSQASESGTQKVGAELRYKLNDKTTLNAEITQQENLSDKDTRLLAEVGIEHQRKQITVNVGLRHTKEELAIKTLDNNTILLGARYTTDSGKITLRGDIERNINSNNGSEISPDRAIVGVDVKLKQGITLFAEHETTDNKDTKTHNSRVGLSKELWKGAKANTTYTKERTDEGQRNYATLGVSQRLKLTKKMSADFSIDHAKTIEDTQKRFNENEPERQGTQTDDYTAFSVGLGSNEKDWSWTSRLELRDGEITDKINFTAGIIRKLENGKQVSGKLSYYNTDKDNDESEKSVKLSFGSAWHPKEKDFVFFSRLDFIDEKSDLSENSDSGIDTHTQKAVHNMHYSRKINKKTQFSIHHGIKRVLDRNKKTKNSATIDTGTLEVRRDVSKKWDIGARAGYLRDWSGNTTETVAGVSVGMTPTENAWIELGYNFEGFDDEDFDNNNYKNKGVYLSFRYKFDQNTLKSNELPSRAK